MGEGTNPDRNRDHTEYNTEDINISDEGEFVGGDKFGGDKVDGDKVDGDKVGGDKVDTGDIYYGPEELGDYERDATGFKDKIVNAAAWLFRQFGADTLTKLYAKTHELPLFHAMFGALAVVGGVSFLDLLNIIPTWALFLFFAVAAIPLIFLFCLISFQLRYEQFACPQCGPFTLRREKTKIVDKPIIWVSYICSECGDVIRSDPYTTEQEN